MKRFMYQPQGVCCKAIEMKIEGDTIHEVTFIGGCSGNTQGIAALVKGMKVEDVINRLSGINCGNRGTSCPDQLTIALKAVK